MNKVEEIGSSVLEAAGNTVVYAVVNAFRIGWNIKARRDGEYGVIGMHHESDDYKKQNYKKAAEYFHLSVENEEEDRACSSASSLAKLYLLGLGVKQCHKQAAKYYKLASKKVHNLDSEGENNLGVYFYKGIGIEQNIEIAKKMFKSANSRGHQNPCAVVNHFLFDSSHPLISPVDNIEAISRLKRSAEKERKGGVLQFKLGVIYEEGKYVNKDLKAARVWFQKSARNGHNRAEIKITPEGGPELELAAKNGNKYAIVKIKVERELALKEEQDEKTIKRAKKGCAIGQYDLVVMSLHFRHDLSGKELSKLVKTSATQGYAKAQYLLGLLYEGGKYTPDNHENESKSFGPMPDDIPENYEPSPSCLFFVPDGVAPDNKKAIKWYILAAKQGHVGAKLRAENLDESLDIDSLITKNTENEVSVNIEETVKRREIEYLVHFTRADNLDSIIKYGLRTRTNINNSDILSIFNDEYRLDKLENSISCSVGFPNYKMFYRLQMENPEVEWVIILLNPSLLWEKDCAFSITNAASGSISSIPLNKRRGASSFSSLFDEIPSRPTRRQLEIPNNFPTDPQAEVLVLEDICIDYVNTIITQNKLSEILLREKYPDMDFLYNDYMFSPRKDFKSWS